jgi:uncharacterized phage-like protein YoqJ
MEHKICCIAGHRPQHFPFGYDENSKEYIKLKKILKKKIEKLIQEGAEHFILGMELGTDTWAAEIILELKEKYPHIILECALPYVAQSIEWTTLQQERYCEIITKCDIKTIVNQEYFPTCFYERNKYMVDKASLVVAIFDGNFSGTGQIINYAKKKGIDVDIIDPNQKNILRYFLTLLVQSLPM